MVLVDGQGIRLRQILSIRHIFEDMATINQFLQRPSNGIPVLKILNSIHHYYLTARVQYKADIARI
ncbi:hypothetical protein DPMN_172763 [Dreissena polymorpha]|uniref:Uncharacterized protein n=1 Tax=Dreissena polymorpha TaxID=45954 RepID=A0A9D4E0D7_DREPO|nr:hypothetical protein DPMN_172763 [Dreissena polymorpha]